MIPINKKTHSNIHSIALHVIANNKIPDREAVLTHLNSQLQISVVGITKTPKGYNVKIDSLSHVDKILSNPNSLKSLNLAPLIPPDIQANRTVLVRGVDDALGKINPAALKTEFTIRNSDFNIVEVIPIPNRTRLFKIVCGDSVTAEKIDKEGLYAFNWKISPHQTEREKYINIQTCYRCYAIEAHHTAQCPTNLSYCSLCAKTGHIHTKCPTPNQTCCITCLRTGNAEQAKGHMTLQLKCPLRKQMRKQIIEDKRPQLNSAPSRSSAPPHPSTRHTLNSKEQDAVFSIRNFPPLSGNNPPPQNTTTTNSLLQTPNITINVNAEKIEISQAKIDTILTAVIAAHVQTSLGGKSFAANAKSNLQKTCNIAIDLPEIPTNENNQIGELITSLINDFASQSKEHRDNTTNNSADSPTELTNSPPNNPTPASSTSTTPELQIDSGEQSSDSELGNHLIPPAATAPPTNSPENTPPLPDNTTFPPSNLSSITPSITSRSENPPNIHASSNANSPFYTPEHPSIPTYPETSAPDAPITANNKISISEKTIQTPPATYVLTPSNPDIDIRKRKIDLESPSPNTLPKKVSKNRSPANLKQARKENNQALVRKRNTSPTNSKQWK